MRSDTLYKLVGVIMIVSFFVFLFLGWFFAGRYVGIVDTGVLVDGVDGILGNFNVDVVAPEIDDDLMILLIAFWAVGFIDLVVGVGFLYFPVFMARRELWFLENGVSVKGDVLSVKQNKTVTIGGKHPFVVRVQWEDSEGFSHISKSSFIWVDPRSKIGENVDVFYDPSRTKKVWVDLRFLNER